MSEIKVFGHQSPDTDATVSAIIWSWFLNEYRGQNANAYILGTPNSEAQFVLEKWGVKMPEILESVSDEDTIAITDTNNIDELFPNINDCDIISIIDHHKLTGGLQTSLPREILIQPYAATVTVMYNTMNIKVEDFPKEIAGLMLSGILSDTLQFRSPTTTEDDRELAESLAYHLGVDITEYANEMFAAKSDISNFTDEELVKLDSKALDIKGKNVRISVLETTTPETVLARREGIIEAIKTVEAQDKLDYLMLYVIDILNEEATLLTHDEVVSEIAAKSFEIDTAEDMTIIPGLVSRKKQIIPALLK